MNPADAMMIEIKGRQELKRGNHEAALKFFAEALAGGIPAAGGYYNLGLVFEKLEQHAKALRAFQQAHSEAGPDLSAEFREKIVDAVDRLKMHRKAAKELALDVLTEVEAVEPHLIGGYDKSRHEFVRLMPEAESATASCRGISDFFNLARSTHEQGDYDLSVGVLEATVNYASAYGVKATALAIASGTLFGLEEIDRARLYFQLAEELNPQDEVLRNVRQAHGHHLEGR